MISGDGVVSHDRRIMKQKERPDKITARGVTALPNGMTPEEAERLVREADERTKENN